MHQSRRWARFSVGRSRRQLGGPYHVPIEESLIPFAFTGFVIMTPSLKTCLLQLCLVSAAFSLITTCSGHRYGLFACIAVSALYSAAFSLFLSRSAVTRNGIAGAVLGFAIALLVGIVPDVFRYFVPGGAEPTFDGDGPLMGFVVLPIFAFLYLLIPIVALGALIGWASSSIRSVVWSQCGSAN